VGVTGQHDSKNYWTINERTNIMIKAIRFLFLFFSVLLVFGLNVVLAEDTIRAAERQSLVALYDSTNGAGWTDSTGWKTDSDPCTWYGVHCAIGHVIWLHLTNNQLSGAITAEIGNLTNLTQLNLGGNQLSGSIPTEIGNLTKLQNLTLEFIISI
jgi:hypothetical protein